MHAAPCRWAATGQLAAIGARKAVIREPRAAGEVEATLSQYAAAIERCSGSPFGGAAAAAGAAGDAGGAAQQAPAAQQPPRRQSGAVMLCVVGGKLAEGINFGDALGRCVVMAGLPYPNPSDPELQERLRYIDRTAAAAAAAAGGSAGSAAGAGGTGSTSGGGTAASRAYYQDLCMKAVNQCVGRVIRHRGDHAAIVLADARSESAGGACCAALRCTVLCCRKGLPDTMLAKNTA